ncbi:peptidase [Streptomyces sp. NPDC000963]
MKIRRILATAVAAAVTTPVVFLSAAPAFADTKPSSASTQKPAQGEEDPEDDKPPTRDELEAAVALAQEAYDDAVVAVAGAKEALKGFDKADHPLKKAIADAEKAAVEAAAAKEAADKALVKAQDEQKALPGDAAPEQKQAAADAVAAAGTAAEAAAAAKTAADAKVTETGTAFTDARDAASRAVTLAEKAQKTASRKLDDAKEELAFYEDMEGACEPNEAVRIALSGPKQVTAGQPAVFSMRVTNTSDRTLDLVDVYVNALREPDLGEDIDEDTDFEEWVLPVEWSSADAPAWTSVGEKFEAIELGELAKGAHHDVKLRLTVAADAPAGEGSIYTFGQYENNDGTCGMSLDDAYADFGILAAKGDKPKPAPTPTPSPSTSTPAPVTTTGNTGTTQQGGSSTTPVTTGGTLAATGANDVLPQLGLAAAGAVALGAGAVFAARRRKAGSQA